MTTTIDSLLTEIDSIKDNINTALSVYTQTDDLKWNEYHKIINQIANVVSATNTPPQAVLDPSEDNNLLELATTNLSVKNSMRFSLAKIQTMTGFKWEDYHTLIQNAINETDDGIYIHSGTLIAGSTSIELPQLATNGVLFVDGLVYAFGTLEEVIEITHDTTSTTLTIDSMDHDTGFIALYSERRLDLYSETGTLAAGSTTITLTGDTPSGGLLILGGECYDLAESTEVVLSGKTITIPSKDFDVNYVVLKSSTSIEIESGTLSAGSSNIGLSSSPSSGILIIGGEGYDLSSGASEASLSGSTITLPTTIYDHDYMVLKIP